METLFHLQFHQTKPETTIADMAWMSQKPGESVMKFIGRFRKAKYECRTMLIEGEYARLVQTNLMFQLKKRFTRQIFPDLMSLVLQVS